MPVQSMSSSMEMRCGRWEPTSTPVELRRHNDVILKSGSCNAHVTITVMLPVDTQVIIIYKVLFNEVQWRRTNNTTTEGSSFTPPCGVCLTNIHTLFSRDYSRLGRVPKDLSKKNFGVYRGGIFYRMDDVPVTQPTVSEHWVIRQLYIKTKQ